VCGLAGFLDNSISHSRLELLEQAERMTQTLIHRGPDDGGAWADPAAGVALGFRRLSIIDLSPAGHQPMESASGRYVIVYNGEVYNAPALRAELCAEGIAPPFRGHSDTESMLACVEAWGLQRSLSRFIGMFAIALWDRQERRLTLVRDRFGVKPLLYGRFGQSLLFGSELRALRAHPAFRAEVSRDSLALLLRHNCVPGPRSIYQGVSKLPPGTFLTVEAGADEVPAPTPYWSAREEALRGIDAPFRGSEPEALDQLDALLRDAVALRMVSDVPLGVFLSGGVDSSLVTALMQAQSGRPVRTFNIGFEQGGYDESMHARDVAAHLGTDHTKLTVTPAEALEVVPRLGSLYDEPFADSSQIPTYLVSQMARRHVTVSLSGDGGDELFGGYNRYFQGPAVWRRLRRTPHSLRGAAGALLAGVGPGTWDALFRTAGPVLPRRLRFSQPGEKMAKLAGLLPAESADAMYCRLVSHWTDPASVVVGASDPLECDIMQVARQSGIEEMTGRMMYLDTISYLPDDILVKVDRASMAVSLEAREPLLDHRLFELAWRLPLALKVRGGTGKWAPRRVLDRYVPATLIDRPKQGFAVPLAEWLRGPLRDWAEALLGESRLRSEGFFRPGPIRRTWAAHLSGARDHHHELWDALMFQAWLEAN
jgi:asparagine synthase (glutamine-hydrolysing)